MIHYLCDLKILDIMNVTIFCLVIPDTRHGTGDKSYRVSHNINEDTGYKRQETGYKIQVTRYKRQGTRYKRQEHNGG
jgi:hypothetical protein